MYRIVYISKASFPVSEVALGEFLRRWRANNERDNITGILLYSAQEQRFMQLIEGEQEAIFTLFRHIERDYRHCRLLKLADGPIGQRSFTSWLMGFQVLTTTAFTQLAGFLDPDGDDWQQALPEEDALVRELLQAFMVKQSPGLP